LKNPELSILTPFYNPGKHFVPCIESILSQSFENWEWILVDDFSTDDSASIINSYNDPRIKVYKNQEKGLINGLRIALANSNGNYISRMDADDIAPKDKYQLLLDKIKPQKQGTVCIGAVKYFNNDGLNEGYQYYEKWLNEVNKASATWQNIYRECTIPSPNFLISRTDLQNIGQFDSDIYPEDYDLAFRMRQHGLKVAFVNEITHLWRDHSERSTRTQEHYNHLNFIPLKVKNIVAEFPDRDIVIWGGAKKGKLIARQLASLNRRYDWVCSNVQRIGHVVYDVKIRDPKEMNWIKDQCVIIAVSNKDEQNNITQTLENQNKTPLEDFFFFF